jgi:branched-chain amino acid transport system ATP-binding protein
MSELLTLRHVGKRFERLQAVQDVALDVPAGMIVGLIGPNGSGKSTLFDVISGGLRADAGEIIFDGRDIAAMPADAIFKLGLARSFQNPSLFFRMTVLDNTLVPAKGQRGERPGPAPLHRLWRRQEAALAAEASDLLDQYGLRGHYDAPAADLSGGQMKLLELGRGLMGSPKLLLLDEPTAGVAPKLAREIFEQIERLRRANGLTFLIIEHRLEILFDFVDIVYVMHLGRVIARGTPAEVAANAEVREIYFGE